jgi:hypothetical protein
MSQERKGRGREGGSHQQRCTHRHIGEESLELISCSPECQEAANAKQQLRTSIEESVSLPCVGESIRHSKPCERRVELQECGRGDRQLMPVSHGNTDRVLERKIEGE